LLNTDSSTAAIASHNNIFFAILFKSPSSGLTLAPIGPPV
jgi:hypothetical protein